MISVVIANWNGRHLLHDCLDSLQKQHFQDFEIIVVDNGSRDGSVAWLNDCYPEVKTIALPENRGFAGGNNAGLDVARGSYIAFLNNDTKVAREWLAELAAAVRRDPSAGMWASKILSMDKPEVLDNTGLLLYWDGTGRGRGRLEQDRGQYDQEKEALFPSGCAALFSREVLAAVGGFDEEYFAYADDVDLGLRARLAGRRCVFVPTAKVFHKYSASSAAYSPFKAFLVERNRLWVLLRLFPGELVLASPYFTLQRLLYQLYGAITKQGASGRFSAQYSLVRALGILLKAWAAALARLPRILGERRRLQGLRKITRKEFYRLLSAFGISAAELALKE